MHVFPIKTLPWKAFFVATGLFCGLPIVLVALTVASIGLMPGWLSVTILAILLGAMLALQIALIVLALYVATRNEVTLRGGTMHLKGGEFHERVPLDNVRGVQRIGGPNDALMPTLKRRNGITLPGFRVGWYQTPAERFVFVIRAGRAPMLYVTTDLRFDVLLGVDDPAALGQRLLANRSDDRD